LLIVTLVTLILFSVITKMTFVVVTKVTVSFYFGNLLNKILSFIPGQQQQLRIPWKVRTQG